MNELVVILERLSNFFFSELEAREGRGKGGRGKREGERGKREEGGRMEEGTKGGMPSVTISVAPFF